MDFGLYHEFWKIVNPQHRPTVKPAENFEPNHDAQTLFSAMKGLGTDEQQIIDVLCFRSNEQRLQIAKTFKTLFGKDLIEAIKSETSFNFKTLLVALLKSPIEYYAQELNWAVKGLGTNENCLIEIMCSLTNYQIKLVSKCYEELYKTPLEEDLVDDTSGYFKRLLRSLSTGRRNESNHVDSEAAMMDAQRLYEAGELVLGTDEATFNEILATRSYPQLKQIFHEYENISGNTMEKAIESEFSGSIKNALLAIVACARNKLDFFAERFYRSMKGLGTDDRALIRLVITHCEVDLEDIKECFAEKYNKTLEEFIKDDTSGDYGKALLCLVSSP